jgi:hypothetical protein
MMVIRACLTLCDSAMAAVGLGHHNERAVGGPAFLLQPDNTSFTLFPLTFTFFSITFLAL